MIAENKKNRSLTFYQPISCGNNSLDNLNMRYSGVISSLTGINAYNTSIQTQSIQSAFTTLKDSVISRGLQYANNNAASRGGFMAENWHAETYNLNAAIEKINTTAEVPAVNSKDSADIIVKYNGNEEKNISLKYYRDAESSAKAQTNPGYKEQDLLIPENHLEEGKRILHKMAEKNTKKGRNEAAEIQLDAKNRLTDRIEGPGNVESIALSKEDDLELAQAITKDKMVNEEKINSIFEKTGVTQRTKNAVLKNELKGVGIAAAIGVGIGFTIGFAISLAQSGITPDSMKYALAEGGKSGIESGAMAIIGYGIGRGVEQLVTPTIQNVLSNCGVQMTNNLIKMCNMGIVGMLTIMVSSVYQYTKLRYQGIAMKEALIQVGKQALFSLSLLAVTIVAQGIFGGPAGIIVSIGMGIIFITYSITDIVYQRELSDSLRNYMIDKCKPILV